MELAFHGATGGTTGSCHLLRAGGRTILLECGLFQGRRASTYGRNLRFGFEPREIDAVILSHAHIDHSGRLPLLVQRGFDGPIYATAATRDLCDAMLRDSANIQLKDAEFLNRQRLLERVRGRRPQRARWRRGDDDPPSLGPSNPAKREILPLYLEEDVRATLKLFRVRECGAWFTLGPRLRVRLHDAGHILGSTWVELESTERAGVRRLVFTGDYGRAQPILRDPTPLAAGDVMIAESTYGARSHPPTDDTDAQLGAAVERLLQRGRGKLLIPAFAVGRTQHVLHALEALFERRRGPALRVVVDSPLAKRATEIVAAHAECFDEEALARLARVQSGASKRLHVSFTETVDDSKMLNRDEGPVIIVSASGMMESGRILHHLAWSVSSPDTEIAIVGYQARGTLGRRLVDGEKEVNILGHRYAVRARVTTLNGFSAHADREGLMNALVPLASQVETLFLVHGDNDQRLPLARALRSAGFVRVECPVNAATWNV
ncbi:MAG: MBL fold metallo-hydrolase [Planctomycetes bacterium]|nr:MBL fold metallo-hydrolase [Planctomycetota bacterium]